MCKSAGSRIALTYAFSQSRSPPVSDRFDDCLIGVQSPTKFRGLVVRRSPQPRAQALEGLSSGLGKQDSVEVGPGRQLWSRAIIM